MSNLSLEIGEKDYSVYWENSIFDEGGNYKFDKATPEFYSLSSNSLKLILNLCRKFDFDAETEFTAYCTFDKFIANYFIKCSNLIKRENWNKNTQRIKLRKVLKKFERQVLVKTINVIMISQKFVDRQILIPINEILQTLYQGGLPCSFEELKQSEYEVFEVLNYQPVPCKLLTIVIFLVKSIYKSKYMQYENIILESCNLIIRYVYLDRKNLMEKYFTEFHSELKNTNLAAAIVLINTQYVPINFNFNDIQIKLTKILSLNLSDLMFVFNELKKNL